MKSILLFIILIGGAAAPISIFADTVFFTDGHSQEGQLLKVTDTAIEYRTKENPFLTAKKSEVSKVTYSNGKTVIISKTNEQTAGETVSDQKTALGKTEKKDRIEKTTFDIAPILSYRSMKFYGNETIKNSKPFTLRPQAKIIPGVKANYNGFGLSLYNSFPYKNNEISAGGFSRFFEADGQYFGKSFGSELTYKKVSKYILEDDSKLWMESSKQMRSDIKANYLRANMFLSSPSRNYSLKNGIGNDGLPEEGLCGSFVLMISAGYNSVKGAAPIDPRSTYYEKSILKNMKMFYTYALPGYAASYSLYNNYVSASIFLIGTGYTRSEYNDLGGTHGQKRVNFLQPAFRFSAGHDGESFFAGGKFDYQSATADMNFKSPSFANMDFVAECFECNIYAGIKF